MVNSKSNKLDSSRVGLSKLQPASSVLTSSLFLEVKSTGTQTLIHSCRFMAIFQLK